MAKTEEIKTVTKQLYDLVDETCQKLLFLLDYSKDAGLQTVVLSGIRSKLNKRNIEGAVKDMRNILPYLQTNLPQLELGGYAGWIFKLFSRCSCSNGTWNRDQITILSDRKALVENNVAFFKNVYEYISRISSSGRRIFRTSVKKDDYTISKSLSKVRIEIKTEKRNESSNT